MISAHIAAWILTILIIFGVINAFREIVKEGDDRKSLSYIIAYGIEIYLYYCIGVFALL